MGTWRITLRWSGLILGALLLISTPIRADSGGECRQSGPYHWPRNLEQFLTQAQEIRLKALGDEMDRFSSQVGVCYARKPEGKAEKLWSRVERDKSLLEIFSSTTVQEFCEEVRTNLVEKQLPNWTLISKRSRFTQYANCGEGALVGACLAKAFGFSEDEVLLCNSIHDHAWSLVPEPGKPDSFCLLDRWNSFRCGVTFSGVKSGSEYIGNYAVPGKQKFKFSDATCVSLSSSVSGAAGQ